MRKSILIITLLLVISSAAVGVRSQTAQRSDVLHQLRIYEIFESTRTAFHARFKDHAMRIMKRYDFKILRMWESRSAEKLEFVYLLEWKDEPTMNAQWKAFLADQEWIDIKKRTNSEKAPLVGEIQSRILMKVAYSP